MNPRCPECGERNGPSIWERNLWLLRHSRCKAAIDDSARLADVAVNTKTGERTEMSNG